jgi:hypothetical protein
MMKTREGLKEKSGWNKKTNNKKHSKPLPRDEFCIKATHVTGYALT